MNDPHVETGVRFGEDLLDRDRSWQDLQAPRRQLPGPRPRLLTGRTEYAELSAVSFSNEGGVATGVQLPLRKRERRRATPETRGKPRTVQGQTVIETGSGKPVGLSRRLRARKSDLDPVRASPCRPAAIINAPHQTGRTHDQRLTRRLELDKEKNPCRRGRPHTKALRLA